MDEDDWREEERKKELREREDIVIVLMTQLGARQ